MAGLKSERHHWWPECVSKHWDDANGSTNWILPSGEIKRAPAKNFGAIGNGHHIKLGKNGEPTVWDSSFEEAYRDADNAFPDVIDWLNQLDRKSEPSRTRLREGFLGQEVSDSEYRRLVECIVSLGVRSPRFRETAVSLAEHYRGPLPEQERNSLIGVNMARCQRRISDLIGTRGKVAVLFPLEREFIFGDGFYSNISAGTESGSNIRMIAPITPYVSVLLALPSRYTVHPRLVTAVLDDREVDFLNDTVQVYANQCVFYKDQSPKIIDAYKQGKHLVYAAPNLITNWIEELPGIPANRFRTGVSLPMRN